MKKCGFPNEKPDFRVITLLEHSLFLPAATRDDQPKPMERVPRRSRQDSPWQELWWPSEAFAVVVIAC
jgi:hypothetical protein